MEANICLSLETYIPASYLVTVTLIKKGQGGHNISQSFEMT